MKRLLFYVVYTVMLTYTLDAKSAKEYQDICAAKDDMEACYKAGLLYEQQGEIAVGRYFFNMACEHNFQKACVKLKEGSEQSTSDEVPDNFMQNTIGSNGEINSYLLEIVRHGIAHKMVVYNYWSGEYPKPVIYVKPTPDGWTKINGYFSLRNPKSRKVCTIRSGIYHPWGKDRTSLIDYYSVIPQVNYIVLKNNMLDEQRIRKGDRLDNEIYIAEGSCNYQLNNKKNITTTCIENFIEDSIESSREFKQIKKPSHPSEQWLYLRCREGHSVFVQDIDLLRQPDVRKGMISGYGKVTTSTRR